MNCPACQTTLNDQARFCSACGCPQTATPYNRQWPRLERPLVGRRIAGVCAAFANRYGWDPLLVRLILVLCVFCGAGAPLLAYFIAWIIIPNEPYPLPVATGVTHS
ncbi:MAG TPA: PspC domain-containing protein [Candidatus Aquilonibacter sp.]|nr:PspC domain-containing protein [Candidatus Aquilonibacter sp.]